MISSDTAQIAFTIIGGTGLALLSGLKLFEAVAGRRSNKAIPLSQESQSPPSLDRKQFVNLVRRGMPRIKEAHKAALRGKTDKAMKLYQFWEIQYHRRLSEVLSEDGSEFDSIIRKIRHRQGGDLTELLDELYGYLSDATIDET